MKSYRIARGMSLLEIMLTVMILAATIGLVAGGMTLAGKQKKADEVRQGLVLLKRNIQNFYQGSAGYSRLSTQNAIALKLADPGLLRNFSHAFADNESGGLAVSADAADVRKFKIKVLRLPADACVALADIFDSDPDFISVAVNSGAAFSGSNATKAADGCATGDNSITYTLQ